MVKRPIFVPDFKTFPYFKTIEIHFQWHSGFAKSQIQKSIYSLHQAAKRQGISSILEISGKSTLQLGVALSAFNLQFSAPNGQRMSVECAYQGSKVFEKGGPYQELYTTSSRKAKTDKRLQTSGELIGFDFLGDCVSVQNRTAFNAFYDCLYITALWENKRAVIPELEKFEGFSDIVFNPTRSFNCQARAVAKFMSLHKNQILTEETMQGMRCLRILTDPTVEKHNSIGPQLSLGVENTLPSEASAEWKGWDPNVDLKLQTGKENENDANLALRG